MSMKDQMTDEVLIGDVIYTSPNYQVIKSESEIHQDSDGFARIVYAIENTQTGMREEEQFVLPLAVARCKLFDYLLQALDSTEDEDLETFVDEFNKPKLDS